MELGLKMTASSIFCWLILLEMIVYVFVQVLSLARPPCVFSIQAKLVMDLFDYSAGYACHVPALEAPYEFNLPKHVFIILGKNKSP
jgi:hypothetical protein